MQLDESEIQEFIGEARELLDEAERALLELAGGAALSAPTFDQIFRCLHSIKGAAGAIGMADLQSYVHGLETYFAALKGHARLESAEVDHLLAGCDHTRGLLEPVGATPPTSASIATVEDATGGEFVNETKDLLKRLGLNLASLEREGARPGLLDEFYRDAHTVKGTALLFGYGEIGRLTHALETFLETLRERPRGLVPAEADRLYQTFDLLERLLAEPPDGVPEDVSRVVDHLVAQFQTPSVAVGPPVPASVIPPEATAGPVEPDGRPGEATTSIRISIQILDQLMALIGEMVLVRNQVIQYANSRDDLEFVNLSQRLDVVTSEMQSEVMKTRMQPIATILTKFQRVVRDLARDLRKKIDISFVGSETEVDRALLEAVKDPLMHIVRNACDHGLESPAARVAAGKPETGRVTVRSYHEGGQVIIEVRDDGRGLDREALARKAVQRNLVAADRAGSLSDAEVFAFIFAAGLSTAEKVTNVSGRGVGMDVVKKNIERIGGMVEVSSEAGRGTTLRIKIPLTLAIIPAMIVRSGAGRYAIPQVKLVELVRIEPKSQSSKLEMLQGRLMYRLRGNLLPVVYLNDALRSPGLVDARDLPSEVTTLIVVNAETVTFGLAVDEILDTADIVVKPLSKLLKSLAVYSGATVLGDGGISLIIDINGLAAALSLRSGAPVEVIPERKTVHVVREEPNEFLLFSLRGAGKHAVPLSIVSRMEEFDVDRFEHSGGVRVTRYGNKLLPILDLQAEMKYEDAPKGDARKIAVIVSKLRGRLVGLEVESILDVIRSDEPIDDSIRDRDAILGSLTSDREVLTVVDVHHVLENSSLGRSQPRARETASGRKILFAEDTEFFRRQITKVLGQAGYDVVTANHGRQALSILRADENSHAEFSLVLTDIEMPEMTGFELAAAVRADARLRSLPLVAITTRFSDAAVAEGRRVGFDEYLEKLNPDALLQAIARLVDRHELEAHG